MKLHIHLVTWNGGKYIPYLFDSLKSQTFKDWELHILDNASTDDTIEIIEEKAKNFPVEMSWQIRKRNLGFAGGHSQLFNRHRFTKYVDMYILLLNQDMYLLPDTLERLVKFMDEHPDASAISPRLMRWNFTTDFTDTDNTDKLKQSFTNQIDTLGLKVLRNRRVIEIGAGQNISNFDPPAGGQISNFTEVFGVSGALPMFRKSVIDKIGLFDDSFGSYKEDVDLAYRLRSAGYKAYTVLDAVAYHDRSASGVQDLNDKIAIENKKNQSEWVKYHSYKNHIMTLIKNEYWQNYLLDLPWIKWYELKKFGYFLLYDRHVLKGLGEIIKRFNDLKIKRLKIKELRKIGWREMRRWWK